MHSRIHSNKLAVLRVDGGIGSQLTQYAFGLFFKEVTGANVKYDVSCFDEYGKDCDNKFNRNFMLLRLWPELDFSIATPGEIALAKKRNHYHNRHSYEVCFGLFRMEFPVYLDGYYENVVYLNGIRDAILRAIDFSDFELDAANKAVLSEIRGAERSCAVHVRRGDFVNLEAVRLSEVLLGFLPRGARTRVRQRVLFEH